MIGELEFGRPEPFGRRTLRRIGFAPRSGVPTTAVCYVASAIRETLRRALGSACEVDVGEPALIDANAWRALAGECYGFHTRGRQNDAVLLIAARDARALVLRAFGEDGAVGDPTCSALELLALERLASEIADVFVPLYGERRTATAYRPSGDLPTCTTIFDVRVRSPIRAVLCVALVRDIARPAPVVTLPPSAILDVRVAARAEFATGVVSAKTLLELSVGDVIPLDTKVGGPATLKVGPACVATGEAGIAGDRAAFLVRKTETNGVSA